MTEYIYFASYRYHQEVPPSPGIPSFKVSGAGRTRIVATQRITTWDDIEAMESAIVEMHPEYESVIVTNYKLMREDAA